MTKYPEKLQRMKGRRAGGSYSTLIHAYFESQEYSQLSARAVKCLVDLLCQYRGNNNGDLTAAWSVMKKRGWRSKSQLGAALRELVAYGWVIVSRYPMIRRQPVLYGLTFFGLDSCGGKLDIAANPVPTNLWKRENGSGVIPFPRSKRHVTRKKTMPLGTGQYDPSYGSRKVSE